MRKQPSFAQMDGNILLKLLCGRHMASAILLLGNKVGDPSPHPQVLEDRFDHSCYHGGRGIGGERK